jgi:hypothetical protein
MHGMLGNLPHLFIKITTNKLTNQLHGVGSVSEVNRSTASQEISHIEWNLPLVRYTLECLCQKLLHKERRKYWDTFREVTFQDRLIVIIKLRHRECSLHEKEIYRNTECSLKRNCIKLMQVFNIILKNPLDVLHR